MVWECAKMGYQSTSKKYRNLELERLKKKTKKTEDDLEDIGENDMKDLDFQIKMVENQNEWRIRPMRATIENDILVHVGDSNLSG